MPKMTKAQRKKLGGLEAARSYAVDRVYSSAKGDLPFSECLKLAPEDVQGAYQNACKSHMEYLFALSDDGRGYWVGGSFREYT